MSTLSAIGIQVLGHYPNISYALESSGGVVLQTAPMDKLCSHGKYCMKMSCARKC